MSKKKFIRGLKLFIKKTLVKKKSIKNILSIIYSSVKLKKIDYFWENKRKMIEYLEKINNQ